MPKKLSNKMKKNSRKNDPISNTDDFSMVSTTISLEKSDQSVQLGKLTEKISSYKENIDILLDVIKEETKRTYLVVERDQNNSGLLRYNKKETVEKFIKGKITDDLSVRQQLSTIEWSKQFLIDELNKSANIDDKMAKFNLNDHQKSYEEMFDRTEKNQKVYYQFDAETILFTPETNLRAIKPASITISGTGSQSSSKETPIRSKNDNLINTFPKRSFNSDYDDFKDSESSVDDDYYESSIVLKIPDEDILDNLENYIKELAKKENISDQLSRRNKSISTYYMQAEGSIMKSFKVPIETIKSLKKPDQRPTSKKWKEILPDLDQRRSKTLLDDNSLNISQTKPKSITKSFNYHLEVINLTLVNSVSTVVTLGYLSAITPPLSQWVTITSQPEQSVTLIPQERQCITITSQPIQSEEFTLSLSKENSVTLNFGHWVTSTPEPEQWIMVTTNPDQLVTIKPEQNQWITIEQKNKSILSSEQMEPVSITLNKTETATVTFGQLTTLTPNPAQWITIRPQSEQLVSVSPKPNQSITITPQVGKADDVTPQPGQWVTIKPPFGKSEAVSLNIDQTKPVTLTLGQLESVQPAPGQWFTIQPQAQIPINVKPKSGQWITISALPTKLVPNDELSNEFQSAIEPTELTFKSSSLSQSIIRSGVQSKQLRRSVAAFKQEQPKSKEFLRKTAITPPLILSELNASNIAETKSKISPKSDSIPTPVERQSEYIEIVSLTLSQSQETILTLGQLTTIKPAPEQWIIVTSEPGQMVKVVPESRVWVTITPQSNQTESMSLSLDDNTKNTTLTLGQIPGPNLSAEQWITVESKRGQSVSFEPKQGQWVTVGPKFEQELSDLNPEIFSLTLSQTETATLTIGQLTSLKPAPRQWVNIIPQSGQIVTVQPEPGQLLTITPQQGQADNILPQPGQWVTIKPPMEPSECISLNLDQKQQPVTLTLGYLPSIQPTTGQWFTIQPQLRLPIIVNPRLGQWVTICALNELPTNEPPKSVQFKNAFELSRLAPKSHAISKKFTRLLSIQSIQTSISVKSRSPSEKTLSFAPSETTSLQTESKLKQSIPPPQPEHTELVSLTLDQSQETTLTVGQLTNIKPIPDQWIIVTSQQGQLVKLVPQSKRWVTITPQSNQTESMSLTLDNNTKNTTLTLGQIPGPNIPIEQWVTVESNHGQSVTVTSKPGQWVTVGPKSEQQVTKQCQNFETVTLTLSQTETTTLTVGQLISITPAPEQWLTITPQSGQTITVQPISGQSLTITPPQGQAEGVYPQPGHWVTIKPPMRQSETMTINMEDPLNASTVTFGQLASASGQWLTVQPKPGQTVMVAPQIGQWVTVAPTLDLPLADETSETKLEKVELMLGESEAFTYTLEACPDDKNITPKSEPKITVIKSKNYLKSKTEETPLIKQSLPRLFSDKKETMIKYRTFRKRKIIESPKSLNDRKTQSLERPKPKHSTLKVERRITIAGQSNPMRKLVIPKQLLKNDGADETSSLEQFRENIFSLEGPKEKIESAKDYRNNKKLKSVQFSCPGTKSVQAQKPLETIIMPKELLTISLKKSDPTTLTLGQWATIKPVPEQTVLIKSNSGQTVTVAPIERQSVTIKAESIQPPDTRMEIVSLPRFNQSKQIPSQSNNNLPQTSKIAIEKPKQNKRIKKRLKINPVETETDYNFNDNITTESDNIIKNLKYRQELKQLNELKNRLNNLKKETNNLEQKKFQELELELAINQKQKEMILERKLLLEKELNQPSTSLINGRLAIVLGSIIALILIVKFILPLIYSLI